jgi:signal transduction histidine kinase/ActR/RegA family two-component response regulator
MTAFRDLPIQRKLLLMTLGPSAAGVLLAGVGFLAWDVVELRREIRQDLLAQARIVSENSSAAMSFLDERIAQENLQILEIRPRVQFACLYDTTGALFARYERNQDASCPPRPPETTSLGWRRYDVVEPVISGSNRVGTLHLSRLTTDVIDRLQFGAITMFALLVLAILTALTIARGMQRAIAAPLLDLADTARKISSTRDYSLRAVPSSRDETGVVVGAVNDMLDRIAERTAELSKANAGLEREIQERRRVESERAAALDREREANRLKDEFLATLSHELRTPLNAVLGWTRVLRAAHAAPATQQRALESIERNARVQARLIEDLLEISRIVTGKLHLQVRDTDLATIVDSAVEIVQPAAAAKRLRLVVDVGVRPAMTAGDPDRLQQVVWNLLSNAVKFTADDGTVTVRLVRDNGYRLTVQDTGTGIDPRFLPHVFEAFRQADGTSTREHGGLGLGLAIAKQLVEAHGGKIHARSGGKDAGATFEVFLPSVLMPRLDHLAADPRIAARPADLFDPSLLRDLHVLVVDDEDDARVLLQTALQQYGADVSTASSVEEALSAFDEAQPDVVLSDIGMPHEDGYSLIRRLRARPAAAGGSVPAIAITAYASSGDRAATRAAGYQAHIAKPFEPAEIARLVAQLGALRPTSS